MKNEIVSMLSCFILLTGSFVFAADHGGGPVPRQTEPCVPFNEKLKVRAAIKRNRAALPTTRALPPPSGMQRYSFYPQAGRLGEDLFGNNYVDLDPSAGAIIDYHGTDYTYDGHRGIDSDLTTFTEQHLGVPVFAALDGQVVAAHDGEPDENTVLVPGTPANYVILDHGGDHETWYYHLKNGSVAVNVGDTVKAGQQLGLTASSGYSTGPHLHFESVKDGTSFEPFTGPENPGTSAWVEQPAFRDTMYLRDFNLTNVNLSNWVGPPTDTARSGTFATGVRNVRFWSIIHNFPANSTFRVRFLRPAGTVSFDSGTQGFNGGGAPFYRWSWWWWSYNINLNVAGNWTVELSVNGAVAISAPLRVQNGIVVNQPPYDVTATFDPPAATANDVIMCRVPFHLLDDPDYDVVSYRYEWHRNGNLVRTSTNAALSDALAANTCVNGDTLTCTVTPKDTLNEGSPFTVSLVVGASSTEPEIAVEEADMPLAHGFNIIAHGSVGFGNGLTKTFRLRNRGGAPLHLEDIATLGDAAGDYTPDDSGTATVLAPGASTTFTVTFQPSALGPRRATLRVLSDDADESAFDIVLDGNAEALTYQLWEQSTDFGPLHHSGLLEDANSDGSSNLAAFAFNLAPYAAIAQPLTPAVGTSGLPSLSPVGDGASQRLRLEFVRRTAESQSGLLYRPQFSSTLNETGPNAWDDATGTLTVTPIDLQWERVVVDDTVQGAPARFGRVIVELLNQE
ncbi:MAG: peptidoglycan DD-metalloendopeptidase family protein [Roseimicrobium sp.]